MPLQTKRPPLPAPNSIVTTDASGKTVYKQDVPPTDIPSKAEIDGKLLGKADWDGTYRAEDSLAMIDTTGELSVTTVSVAEASILKGTTEATTTTLEDSDRVVVNDSGTMVQVAMSDIYTYIDSKIVDAKPAKSPEFFEWAGFVVDSSYEEIYNKNGIRIVLQAGSDGDMYAYLYNETGENLAYSSPRDLGQDRVKSILYNGNPIAVNYGDSGDYSSQSLNSVFVRDHLTNTSEHASSFIVVRTETMNRDVSDGMFMLIRMWRGK